MLYTNPEFLLLLLATVAGNEWLDINHPNLAGARKVTGRVAAWTAQAWCGGPSR